MTDVTGPGAATHAAARPADVPRRAEGVELLGEMKGSGYRRPPALARRPDGQVVQLTPLLHAVLQAVDGERDAAEVARVASAATGRTMTAGNVETLLEKLRPMGLVAGNDGAQPAPHRTNPLLALRFKVAVTEPERTRALTAPFARLFHPLLVVAVVAVFAWICWWVLFERGLAAATHQAFARPGLLLAVLALTILSGGFHEFGHAAAARRGGATPGVMGAGLYLIWPAFYTDVTDSYRLGRIGRLRTDLGGLYFNAIVVLATALAWWATGYDAVLLLVATQLLQMLRQLLPFVRFDGYHVLADITGVPDLFHRIGPTLKSLVPGRATDPRAGDLLPWARAVVTVWVLVVVPFFAFTLVTMLLKVPRVVGTALVSADLQRHEMLAAAHRGDLVTTTARGLAMVVVALPILAFVVLFVRLGRRTAVGTWRRTAGRPVQRAGAGLLACALVAGLTWAWWPHPGRYRPIESWEGGTLAQLVPGLARPAPGLAVGSTGRSIAYFPTGQVPTRDHPVLAAVLVPHDAGGPTTAQPGGAGAGTAPAATGSASAWIFPFDQPPAPGPGDTQALAVNTQDDTVTYDTAFALVWADGSEPVTNTNEAYAVASCEHCAAVAVSFQVVLVVGQADIAVPQNVSVAVNYDCTSCLTYSLAVQLFVTLDGPLTADQTARLDALWQQVMAYGAHLDEVPLSEIRGTLSQFETQILTIVGVDPSALTSPSASPSASSSASPSASPSGSPTDGASPSTAVPSATASAGSASTGASPGATASATPSSGPSASGSSSAPSSGPSSAPSAAASTTPSPTSTSPSAATESSLASSGTSSTADAPQSAVPPS